MSDFNDIDDQSWRDEPEEENDGRVEDGEVTECKACGVTMHLYTEDGGICPACAWEGWTTTTAYTVAKGDRVSVKGTQYDVVAEDFIDRKVVELVLSGGKSVCYRPLDPVTIHRP